MKKILSFIFLSLTTITSCLIAQPPGELNRLNEQHILMNNNSPQAIGNQQNIRWLTNVSEASSASLSTAKPILILFTGTNWCPACKLLESNVLTQSQFIQTVASKFIFLKAELSSPSDAALNQSPYKSLIEKYNIQTYPTMVVANAKGDPLFRVEYQSGNAQMSSLQMYLQRLMKGINQL